MSSKVASSARIVRPILGAAACRSPGRESNGTGGGGHRGHACHAPANSAPAVDAPRTKRTIRDGRALVRVADGGVADARDHEAPRAWDPRRDSSQTTKPACGGPPPPCRMRVGTRGTAASAREQALAGRPASAGRG